LLVHCQRVAAWRTYKGKSWHRPWLQTHKTSANIKFAVLG
jgi:hypothetical protein